MTSIKATDFLIPWLEKLRATGVPNAFCIQDFERRGLIVKRDVGGGWGSEILLADEVTELARSYGCGWSGPYDGMSKRCPLYFVFDLERSEQACDDAANGHEA